jgi:hypothetical protein
MTPRKQRGKIRRTNIYTKGKIRRTYLYTIRLNNRPPLKKAGRSDGHINILRGKIRQTHIYTKEQDQTDTYIY